MVSTRALDASDPAFEPGPANLSDKNWALFKHQIKSSTAYVGKNTPTSCSSLLTLAVALANLGTEARRCRV